MPSHHPLLSTTCHSQATKPTTCGGGNRQRLPDLLRPSTSRDDSYPDPNRFTTKSQRVHQRRCTTMITINKCDGQFVDRSTAATGMYYMEKAQDADDFNKKNRDYFIHPTDQDLYDLDPRHWYAAMRCCARSYISGKHVR